MTTRTEDLPRLDSPNRPFILTPYEVEATDREGWLAKRRLGIGASDSPKILGLSQYGNPLTVFMEKTSDWSDDGAIEAAEMGQELEGPLGRMYARKTNVTLRPKVGTLRHPDHPWMLASPDFLTVEGTPALVEVKCRTDRMAEAWGDEWDLQVPDDIWVQVQQQMAVTGFTTCDVVVAFGGSRLRWIRVERDEEFITDLIAAGHNFWHNHILPGIPPAADGSPATTEMLSGLWWPGKDTENRINLDESDRADLQIIADMKADIKTFEAAQKAAENRIKMRMGEGTHGYIDDQLVLRWKEFTRRDVKTKDMRAAHPGIVSEFTTETEYRKFDPTWPPRPRKAKSDEGEPK